MATKVLIVEDEEQIARFVELELRHEGYSTDKAVDGRTGLEKAESGEYDIVLLDIMLPELNGLEVLRRLRRTSDVPVILLTARDSVMDKVSGLDLGAVDPAAYSVTYNGIAIELSKREFDLLTLLLTNRNIVLGRDTLLQKVCGYDYVGETNVIDVYIRYLRSKIDERFGIHMIQTVRGVGYVIKDE